MVWIQERMFVCVCFLGQSGEILKKAKEHTKQINDMQSSVDLTMVISASKDNTAKVRRTQVRATCFLFDLLPLSPLLAV